MPSTSLHRPLRFGSIELRNRIVMAPMTRSRAENAIPGPLVRDYYAQRASAGLLITEGTAPSPNALGYARIPGIFNLDQVAGWREVTRAVHRAGGNIVVQLMHTGRVAHPANLPLGARILAPSAVRPELGMHTDAGGELPIPEPAAMTEADVREAREEFVSAARNAIAAGFDGVELHAANGYLLEQFLHPHTNRRTDAYGGTAERRSRFVREVAGSVAEAIGPDRVGVRLSPFSTLGDLPEHPEAGEQYTALAKDLRGLLYLHIVGNPHPESEPVARAIRAAFDGVLVLNGGFDAARATAAIDEGRTDLVSFGRPFLANPDFVERVRRGAALATPDFTKLYTPGPNGYTDYPRLEDSRLEDVRLDQRGPQ